LDWLTLLAQTTDAVVSATTAVPPPPGATAGKAAAPTWLQFLASPIGMMIPLLLLFLWISVSSKRKQERERTTFLDSLKKGDRVRMVGGELGSIVETRDGRVLLKVDETSNTKIWYARDAVQGIEKEDAK